MSQLDRAVLERLRTTVGDAAFVELVAEFLRDCDRLAAALVDAVESCDSDAAKRHAHELKGMAQLFGAKHLANVCTEADRTGDLGSANAALGIVPDVRKDVLVVMGTGAA